ncbi:MAG: tRNA 2-selenouridine(34) synthase MnmH, partial [Flavobacteriales bacterium]|nr:tRNA 2-selenouridine(34) synthase MnmH [Flavobacteriales bacterium]
MSSRAIILDEFLTASRDGYVCLDARSPAEFAHAHVHGAVNLPLLNDEERHEVGLTYKNEGKDAAAKKGFSLVGHKFVDYIRQAESHSPQKRLAIYCWRGGLRSHVMAWVMSTAGFDVVILKGGYKTWRQRVLEILDTEFHMTVLSGKTGCGKTECLQRLREIGEPVIDLEGLAHHRGSTYGALGMPQQPSQEMFENELARHILMTGNSFWVEDE